MTTHRCSRAARLVRLAPFALAATAGCLLIPPGWAAAQASRVQSGYWSQVPAGPQVPSGGTEVSSNSAAGPTAVSAYRFDLPDGESAGVLTLQVATAQPASQVALIGCPVSASSAGWQPPSGGGALSNAPKPDCSHGSVSGNLSADGSSVTFELSRLDFGGSTVDLLVEPDTVSSPVPAGVSPGSSSSYNTFEVDFQPVSAGSLSTTGTPTASGTESNAGSANSLSSPAPSPGSLSFALPASPGAGAPPTGYAVSAPAGTSPSLGPLAGGVASPAVANSSPSVSAPPTAAPLGEERTSPIAAESTSPWRWRAELALGLILADLLAVMWYQEKTERKTSDGKPLSIYDPPPPELSNNVSRSKALLG